jgi:hypothetical protein
LMVARPELFRCTGSAPDVIVPVIVPVIDNGNDNIIAK